MHPSTSQIVLVVRRLDLEPLVLVTYSDNWADEMDINGFTIVSKEKYNKFMSEVHKTEHYPFEFYVGTNEEIPYESPDDILRALTFKDISQSEAELIAKLFNLELQDDGNLSDYFGFCVFDRVIDSYAYEYAEEDEEL